MGSAGPVTLSYKDVSCGFDDFYESVDNRRYFYKRLKILVSSIIRKMGETTSDGKTDS